MAAKSSGIKIKSANIIIGTGGNIAFRLYRAYLLVESTGSGVNTYTYDITGIHITSQNGTVMSYIKDSHGSVIRTADASGNAMQEAEYSADYDAFGNCYKGVRNTPFGYCGEYVDSESGNVYLRNRYYNRSTGRFITEDPAQDGLNWYVYAGNNPVSFVDPWGLKYIKLREFVESQGGNVFWEAMSKVAHVSANGNNAWVRNGDANGSFIQDDTMYVWDEYIYGALGYYVSDSMKAVNYGLIYGQEGVHNPDYNYYEGMNCANFVSQCLYNGGFNMNPTWYYTSIRNSAAWGVADDLYRYLVDDLGFSVSYIPNGSSISDVASYCKSGDVVAWNNFDEVAKGVINHVGIVSDILDGNIFYCGNTNSRSNSILSNSAFNGDIYIIHVTYPDEEEIIYEFR